MRAVWIGVAAALLVSGLSWAQVPVGRTISYQGTLTNAAGQPVADGNYQVTFRLYGAATGGTAFFTETQTVTTFRGVFSALIGGVTSGGIPPVAQLDFQVYLGISIGTAPEMTPRVVLSPSPHALKALGLRLPMGVQHGESGAVPLLGLSNSHPNPTQPVLVVQATTTNAGATPVAVAGRVSVARIDSAGIRGEASGEGDVGSGAGVHGVHFNAGSGVYGQSQRGPGVMGYSRSGPGGVFRSDATSSAAAGIVAQSSFGHGGEFSATGTPGVFAGVRASHLNGGIAGDFLTWGGSGPAIQAQSTGRAARFYGSGSEDTVLIRHDGTSGNLLTLETGSSRVARIDRTGRGFFNGGTQTGGADLAESFEVEGERDAYEPGDVLVISRRTDRTMERSAEPRSPRVAGVFATKPGVLLSDLDIDADHSHRVPVAVVGVVPTKVSAENGPIRRGDLLVTAATPGHAMRAGDSPAVGTVLGKALQDFEGPDTGVINVLVNVK